MTDEELNEVEEEEEPQEEASDNGEISLDYDMDPIERLQIEIDNEKDGFTSVIGNFLLEQFKKDEVLADCYRTRKVTLKVVSEKIYAQAKAYAKGSSSLAVDNEVVYGWALHIVQDEKLETPKDDSYKLTKKDKETAKAKAIAKFEQDEYAKLEAAKKKAEEKEKAKRKAAAAEKEKKKREESGQISLFDDWGDDDA